MTKTVFTHQRLTAVVVFSTVCLLAGTARADILIDLTQFPDGSPVSEGTVLDDQWRDIGVLFGARRSDEPVLENSNTIDPIADFFTSTNRGFLFYDPDVFGAVAIFDFVEPGTNIPAPVTSFSGIVDGNFQNGEKIDFVAFDQAGNVVATSTNSGTQGGNTPVGIDSSTPFYSLEMRTFGNPGIAVGTLAYTPVPEPSSSLFFVAASLVVAIRRSRSMH